jgi:membrane associated rhomboid family serine protease
MPIKITPAVKILLISCFVVFLVQQTADQFMGGNVTGWLGLVPTGIIFGHRYWQLFTYAFLHFDVMHLFFNLLMLAFIGGELEAVWGTRRFFFYYFFCSVMAGMLYLILQLFVTGHLDQPMVGASGAIYGLLMAYGLIFGERVLLFMMLFPMKAKHFVWILAGIEFMSSIYGSRGGLASAAHLGGMLAGLAYLWSKATWTIYRRRAAEKPKAKRAKSNHLRLVSGKPPKQSEEDVDDGPKTWH